MLYQFDEKIDLAIKKSLKSTLRLFKEKRKHAQESGASEPPPTYEEFTSALKIAMDWNIRTELNKLRTPNLRELFGRAWSQKLRNYAIQKETREAYQALLRRY